MLFLVYRIFGMLAWRKGYRGANQDHHQVGLELAEGAEGEGVAEEDGMDEGVDGDGDVAGDGS